MGVGVQGGTLDGFPTFFIDLARLPFRPEALPLLMVAKGTREREMVEFLIDHFHEYPQHVRFLRELHVQTLREVLRMKQLTPEQIGIDYRALLDLIGEEQVVKELVRRKGTQWLRAMLERLAQQRDTPDAPQAPASPET